MALEDLTPAVREEAILDGADIDPATRLEYFMKKAANEVPKPTGVSDAGKVLTVNEDGDGFILDEVDPGLPDIAGVSDAGKVVSVNAGGSAYELTELSEGYIVQASSDTVKGTIQTLIGDVLTNILTNSKTNMVTKSATLTHSDLASDYAKLRAAAAEYCKGKHVLFPLDVDTYSTAVNGWYASSAGAYLEFIVPYYSVTVPGVGSKIIFLVINLYSPNGSFYMVSASAQIQEVIS